MIKPSIATSALTVLVAVAALGQTPAPVRPTNPALRPAPVAPFTAMDADRDGRVSRTEAQSNSALTSAWSTLDSNGDTYLSEAEFGKWKAPASGGPMGTQPGGTTPETAADPQDFSVPQNATDSQPATSTPPTAIDPNRAGGASATPGSR